MKGPSAERASTSPAADTAASKVEKSELVETISGMDMGLDIGFGSGSALGSDFCLEKDLPDAPVMIAGQPFLQTVLKSIF